MNEAIPCCGNCRFSLGDEKHIYCSKLGFEVLGYAACFEFENKHKEKEVKCDENSSTDK